MVWNSEEIGLAKEGVQIHKIRLTSFMDDPLAKAKQAEQFGFGLGLGLGLC